MNAREYLEILKRNALSQSWAGEALARSQTTGRRWGCGTSRIPKAIAILLRLIDAKKITPKDVAEASQKKPET